VGAADVDVAGGDAVFIILVATADVLDLGKNITESLIDSISLGEDVGNENLEGLEILVGGSL
jgi:hypothetical protein